MKTADTETIKVVDLAKWNVVKDYAKAKLEGIEGAILKVINKQNKPDDGFERHLQGCLDAGIPVIGGYNYLYATTVSAAINAAKAWLQVADGRIPMCWLDLEDNSIKSLPKKTMLNIIAAYKGIITEAGIQFGIYCNLDWYQNVLDVTNIDAPFWIARYGNNNGTANESFKPNIMHTMYGWQYSSKCYVDGIGGQCDLNEWYVEIEAADVVQEVTEYDQKQFIKEMAVALRMTPESTGKQVLLKTITISANRNRSHACVTALERFMKYGGFYTGVIEKDLGKIPKFGAGMMKATILFQQQKVHLKNPDAVWTSGANSYKIALNAM